VLENLSNKDELEIETVDFGNLLEDGIEINIDSEKIKEFENKNINTQAQQKQTKQNEKKK
jgi:hypothetical protein